MAQSHAKKVPAVITPEFFQEEVSKLVTKESFQREVSKLATKDELKEAVAKLATKKELYDAIALLATKAESASKQDLAEVKEELSEQIEDLRQEIREIITGQDKAMTILMRLDTDRLSLTHGQRRLQTTVDDHETRLRLLEHGRTTS